jgi:hypothetical protein
MCATPRFHMPGRDITAPSRPNPVLSVGRTDVALASIDIRNQVNALHTRETAIRTGKLHWRGKRGDVDPLARAIDVGGGVPPLPSL